MPQISNKKIVKNLLRVKTKKTEVSQKKHSKRIASKKSAQPNPEKSTQKVKVNTNVPIFDINGRKQGLINLPKEIFGQEPNKLLLAQAVRVYLANMSTHKASTKTRAEVRGGGTKPWRQKGTGRARAGSIRSPLWVGGGVVFGPKPKEATLSLPKKMKRKALICALSSKSNEGSIKVISNFEKLEPKTKLAKNLLDKLEMSGTILVVLEDSKPNVKLAARNIPNVSVDIVSNLNAYEVIVHKNLLFSRGAIEKMT